MPATAPDLLANYPAKSTTLPAATPTSVDVPVANARDWTLVVRNTGANPVTALSVAVSPLGVTMGEATSVTSGIPIAAGDALTIRGADEPVATVRLTLTSTSGTTVSIEGAGR